MVSGDENLSLIAACLLAIRLGVGALESPVILNLGFMVLTFSIQLRITIASIIGVILAIIAYKVI